MKQSTNITVVLSWFNLVVASILVFSGLVMGLTSGNVLGLLTSAVLASAIILHSYAALQLRKSILNPEIPLSNQTPVGIRFIGYVALFFAFVNVINSVTILQHTQDFIRQIKLPANSPNVDIGKLLRGVSVFAILFSITIFMNVTFNFRLLKEYLKSREE